MIDYFQEKKRLESTGSCLTFSEKVNKNNIYVQENRKTVQRRTTTIMKTYPTVTNEWLKTNARDILGDHDRDILPEIDQYPGDHEIGLSRSAIRQIERREQVYESWIYIGPGNRAYFRSRKRGMYNSSFLER